MPLPQRFLGRDLFWYLETTGLIRKTTASRIGRRMAGRDTLIGSSPRALRRKHGVRLHGRAVDAAGSTISFSDGAKVEAGTVIWATGFRADYSWIDVPVIDQNGEVEQQRGVTASPGLYFLGLPWQSRRGSSFIWGVWHDAKHLADHISTQRKYLAYHAAASRVSADA